MTLETAHVTIDVFQVENERLDEAKIILKNAFSTYMKTVKIEETRYVSFEGLGMFGTSVLFAKPSSGRDFLQDIHKMFRQALKNARIKIHGYDAYTPHLTLLQAPHGSDIPRACLEGTAGVELGRQEVKQIQLLSILKKKDSVGYYHCEDSYQLSLNQ